MDDDDRRSVAAASEAERLAASPQALGLVLRVHRELSLADQASVLLGEIVGACDGTSGIALGPVEDRRVWAPIASTMARDDPRLAALERVEPSRLKTKLVDGRGVYAGLGPLDEFGSRWSGHAPAHTLHIPLLGSEGTWGGLLVVLLDEVPSASTLEAVGALLEHVRPAIDNALRVLAMRELVIKDDTAACYNRRHFESSLPDELARAGRFHAPLSLIFLDMDNLKEVNTKFGHAAGSRTLMDVARRIRGKIRRFDKLFRFGGDEFCIVLPETPWHGALEVAERVREAIAGRNFLSDLPDASDGIRMTASLGIAAFPLHARDKRELIEQADRAMQRIKQGSKNSIGIAEIVGDQT